MIITALLLSLACAAPPSNASQDPDRQAVRSENGRFLAEVRPLPQPPTPATSRVEVTVFERRGGNDTQKQWSLVYDRPARALTQLLTDDGADWIVIDAFAEQRALLAVYRKGLPLASFDAAALQLSKESPNAPKLGETWLSSDPSAVRLRKERVGLSDVYFLDALGCDGVLRSIDLSNGVLRIGSAAPDAQEITVEPAASAQTDTQAQRVYLGTWFAPPFAVEGEPYAVHVRGNLPTPAWTFVGFELTQGAGAPRDPTTGRAPPAGDALRLDLVPLARPGAADAPSVQVLEPFEATATIRGLRAGTYQLALRSRDDARNGAPRRLVVQPRGLLIALHSTGGITGRARTTRVFADGRVEIASERDVPTTFLLPVAEQRALAEQVAKLPLDAQEVAKSRGADLLVYTLDWPSADGLHELVRDDLSLKGDVFELVHTLRSLAPPSVKAAAPAARHVIDYYKSSIEVRTASSGLLSAVGHDHKIMVREFGGEVSVLPDDLEHATLRLSMRAASLAIVDAHNEEDRPSIEREMHKNVLESARYPEIVFESRSVRVVKDSQPPGGIVISGELTLHGVTRKVDVPATIAFDGPLLRAVGKVSVAQTDFGMRPTSAAAGTIKVADKVEILFDVTAQRE